jgi:hypothetical protein
MTLANRCEPDWQLLLHFHTEELSLHSRQTAHDARCTMHDSKGRGGAISRFELVVSKWAKLRVSANFPRHRGRSTVDGLHDAE